MTIHGIDRRTAATVAAPRTDLRPHLTDPAPLWEALHRTGTRVAYAEDLRLWLIPGHADIRAALADDDTFRNNLTLFPVYDLHPDALALVAQIDAPPTTAAADQPIHTRTRAALRTCFPNTAPKVEEQYGPIVRRRVDELVLRVAARTGLVDLAPPLAALPLAVICDLLGVPPRHVDRVQAWADGQIALVWNPDTPPAEQVRLARGLLDFWRYTQALVEDRAHGPLDGHDFITGVLLYRGSDNAVPLSLDEVASLAFNLLVAGHETTAGLLTHAVDLALSDPDRWCALVREPEAVPAFVEEVLRHSPAIDGWLRTTAHPATIGDVTIPAGQRVLLMLGAAGHDPAEHPQPDRFNPDRADLQHLAFGHGPHYCAGAALARLEAVTALTALTQAIPGLRLAEPWTRAFKPNVAFRAHTSLPAVIP